MFVAAPHSTAPALTVPVALAATDPGSSRLVYAMVIGLVVVGIALVVLGIWIIRQTRPDLPVLAPLERMGDRDWKKRDPATQRRMLDELRPAGAEPLAAQAPPPPLDADFEQSDHPVPSLSDLGPGVLAQPVEAASSAPGDDSPTVDALETEATEPSESDSAEIGADDSDSERDVDDPDPDDDLEVGDAEIGDRADDDIEVDDARPADREAGTADVDLEESAAGDDDERLDDVTADQR